MRKINSLINDSLNNTAYAQANTLNLLAKKVQLHAVLQQFWLAATPSLISEFSFVGSLVTGLLTVYAKTAIVASKIKLNHANILTQLQDLQQLNPTYQPYKVTAIVVKVQVKSNFKPRLKTPLKVSLAAANKLNSFADSLGESALSYQLKSLASKI